MGQVITKLEQIGNVASLSLAANVGYVRNSGNTAWETAPLARTNAANTFAATQTISSGGLVVSGGGITSNPGGGTNSEAYGSTASTGSQSNCTAVGQAAVANVAADATALGKTSAATGVRSVSIGVNSTASGSEAIAIGRSATASNSNSYAIGKSANASGTNSFAFGGGTTTTENNLARFSTSTNVAGYTLAIASPSSTATQRDLSTFVCSYVVSTDASRTARMVLNVFDTAAREALRIEASGSAAMIGFLGAAATARVAITGSRGGNAALANLLTELATKGLITNSTTA